MVGGEQVTRRLDSNVGDEQQIAGRDQLLRTPLGRLRRPAAAAEQPHDHARGENLDCAIDPEPDQRDRSGSDTGDNGDRELDHVPRVSAQRKQSCAPLEALALVCRQDSQPRLQL